MSTPVERYSTSEPLTIVRFLREEMRTPQFWSAVAGFMLLIGCIVAALAMQIPN